LISDPKVVANEFNKYFANVANNDSIHRQPIDTASDPNITSSMFLKPATQREIIDIFQNLPPKKSTDINGLSQ